MEFTLADVLHRKLGTKSYNFKIEIKFSCPGYILENHNSRIIELQGFTLYYRCKKYSRVSSYYPVCISVHFHHVTIYYTCLHYIKGYELKVIPPKTRHEKILLNYFDLQLLFHNLFNLQCIM